MYKIASQEISAEEEPPRCLMWVKGRLNKHGEFDKPLVKEVVEKIVS
jgi:hypothetical protein